MEVIEAPLLRVPFESLKRAAKDRKSYVDEVEEAVKETLSPSTSGASKATRLEKLDELLDRLRGLKRKLEEASECEREEASRCKARLAHLSDIGLPAKGQAIGWTKKRLDRILVDYLLRAGYHDAAQQLTQEAGAPELVDKHIFQGARRVVEALRAHDAGPALAWCEEHRTKLRKARSRLEFRLRVQEFLEMVRREEKLEAIAYARAHLAPWAAQYMPELQRALATLAFGPHTRCAAYRPLFEPGVWAALADAYMKDLYRIANLTPEPLLAVHFQAGLSALKTPLAYQPGCSKEDPLHLPSFQQLAAGLPYAKHVRSQLICSVTKQMMNDANPPMALPNGYVFSQRAIDLIAARNQGAVVCPKTGQVYPLQELRRAYIV